MITNASELNLQRKQTLAFIKADYARIVLYRSEWVSDGEGGVTPQAPEPLAAQTMRMIPRQDTSTQISTADGEMVTPQYVLLGRWDADIQRWDEFTLDDNRYQVVSVAENRQYETKAEVYYLG